ncbi:hypothetical protein [Bordetella petrii]|uniref:hypothetical protein n=1 Tax=Bordetella petrii TaxID=94624 RepID=UPI001E47C81F|nr:hypothetical protein [Bordetella petrii]MCD0501959.1 hypothetical protein [Bordetella petrii]
MPTAPVDAPLTVLLYTEEQRGNRLVESPVIGMMSDVSGAEKLIAIRDPHNRITYLYRIDHGSNNLDAVAITEQDPANFDGKHSVTINATGFRLGTPQNAIQLLRGKTRWIQDKGSVLSVLLRNAASRHTGFATRQIHRDRVRYIPEGVPVEPLPRG